MIIYKLASGDCVHRYNKSLVIPFEGPRGVLSTSPLNGGYHNNLEAIFNNDGNPGAGIAAKLRAPTYAEHLALIAREIGLDPATTTGISTAASMERVSIKTETFEDLTVTALVTGGVEVNGGRVGDPATYYEKDGETVMIPPGTINILLVINANLLEGTLARALVTATEAKTAALQELMAGSHYSHGLATGSGTDGTIVVSNPEINLSLTDAGKHSKLGELIGLAVKNALKEALYQQTGLCPESQHSILRRCRRYGLDEDKIWAEYSRVERAEVLKKAGFIHNLHSIDRDQELVVLTSLYLHLLDQVDWGLLSGSEVNAAASLLLEQMATHLQVEYIWQKPLEENRMDGMMDNFTRLMVAAGGKNNV